MSYGMLFNCCINVIFIDTVEEKPSSEKSSDSTDSLFGRDEISDTSTVPSETESKYHRV
jgi:hypothetical protein